MNARPLVARFLIYGGLLGLMSAASAQQAPPQSEQAKQTVALVEKAAALLDAKGKAAFAELPKPNSEWRHGDTYLFVNDTKGTNLFNGGFPMFEGTNNRDLKDSNGKLIVVEQLKVVQSPAGAGWVDYMWPKPGQTKPSHKWSYVKAVKVDGAPGYVGAGFYSD
ncbi:MAG TPA: cache domain-containing protein [Burkholderiales bacterium]|nr:cache domain-containing protein [Burkholderiales bacterium]